MEMPNRGFGVNVIHSVHASFTLKFCHKIFVTQNSRGEVKESSPFQKQNVSQSIILSPDSWTPQGTSPNPGKRHQLALKDRLRHTDLPKEACLTTFKHGQCLTLIHKTLKIQKTSFHWIEDCKGHGRDRVHKKFCHHWDIKCFEPPSAWKPIMDWANTFFWEK